MTLQQLTYVVTVAEKGSMNKAAQELFLAQSSLSTGIQNLEEEIGLELFYRTNRGIRITPEGEEFLNYARQIVEQFRLTEKKFVEKKQTKKSFSVSSQHYTFVVSAFIDLASCFGPDEYDFGIYECKTSEIIENVRNMRSELGIIYLDDFNEEMLGRTLEDNGLIFEELFPCRTFAYLSAGHPLAKREKVTLEDLEPYPCLSFDQGSDQALYLAEEVFSTYDYRQRIRTSDRGTMLNLMTGLNGYTLCSGIICEDLNGPGYTVIPLDTDKIMHVGYIRRRDSALSHLARLYIEKLRKYQKNIL